MPRRDFSKVAFAATGDTNVIPTPTQPDGSISLQTGWGFDYQRDNGAGGGTPDPLAKNIDREDMNGILNEITASIGEIQQNGFPVWVATAAPYPINAVVRHNDQLWRSTITNNNSTPGSNSDWTARSGKLIRVLRYSRVAGVQMVSVNGGTPTATGAGTYTPSPDLFLADVQAVGGGGAGGGTVNPSAGNVALGAPGSSGSYGRSLLTLAQLGPSQLITVGLGGVGVSAAAGGSGGATSIGSILTCPGGGGGASTPAPGALPPQVLGSTSGTSPSTGANLVSSIGAPGGPSIAIAANAVSSFGGQGGGNLLGAATQFAGANTAGVAGTGFGSGGSGLAIMPGVGPANGTPGGAGVMMIWEWE